MKILALESSTTSAKSMLFDTVTQAVEVSTRRFTTHSPDGAVREAEANYLELLSHGREAAAGHDVDMIVLSGTYHGLGLLSAEGTALTPVYEWPYTGARELCARLRQDEEFTDWFYRRTGCMVNASYPAFKLRHLRDDLGVDITGATVIDHGSYGFFRMTGKRWTSVSVASGTGLLNVETAQWDTEILARLGVEGVLFPELHDSEAHAPLTEDAAALLGVRPGIPVLVPGPDGGLSQVGDQATNVGDMTFSMGTSGAMRFATESPTTSPNQSTWAYRSPLGWMSGAATSGCTNCVDWAKNRLFPDLGFDEIEKQLRVDTERELPVFLPFLFGERCPGWQDTRLGGFEEVGPEHENIDLYQGVLEGIVFSLYHCYQELTALNGTPRRIILSGGVLSSPFWTQLAADVFGMPFQVTTLQHSSVTGAIRMGLRAAGLDDDQPAFRSEHPRIVTPNPELRAHYDQRFARYLDAYHRSAPAVREAIR